MIPLQKLVIIITVTSVTLFFAVGLGIASLSTEVSVTPQGQNTSPGETSTYYITVDNAQGGVGAYDVTIIARGKDVTITGIKQTINAPRATVDKTYGFQNNSVTLTAGLGNTQQTGTVRIARVEVTGHEPGANANIAVRVNALSDESGAKYTVSQSNPASLTVTSKTTGVRLNPGIKTAALGTETEFDVLVDNADGGVGVFDLQVSTRNAKIISINQTIGASPQTTATEWGATNHTVRLTIALGNTADVGSVKIASVRVAGERGTSLANVNLTVESLGDERGKLYTVSTTNNATLHIKDKQAPVVTGNKPVQDLNDDARYEDITGDGTHNIVDVQALFANLHTDAIQSNVNLFDFNNDGMVNIVDVQALFAQL